MRMESVSRISEGIFHTQGSKVKKVLFFLAIAVSMSTASLIPNDKTLPMNSNLYSTNSDQPSHSNDLFNPPTADQSVEVLKKPFFTAKCTKEEMATLSIQGIFPNEFKGRVYAANYPDEPDCGVNLAAKPSTNITFSLPIGECGIQMTKTNLDENVENILKYEVVLYIQYSAFLQQAHDEKIPLLCFSRIQSEDDQVDSLESNKNMNPIENNGSRRQGRRMKHLGGPRDASSPNPKPGGATKIAEAIMEIINGKDPSPKSKKVYPVAVGDDVTLVITTKVMRGYDARIVNCTTHDGSRSSAAASASDSSRVQPILDSAGCSVDKGLVPNFRRRRLPVESRNRLITLHFTSFPAFKFPERDHLHIKCAVAYCKGPCPQESCDSGINHFGSWRDKYGRISDVLVETSPVVNAIEVLSPELEPPGGHGGHHYESHQSDALGLSVPLGTPSSAAGGQQHLGLESSSNQQNDERSSSSYSDNSQEQDMSNTNHYGGQQSMNRQSPYHSSYNSNNNNLPSPSSIYGGSNNGLPNSSNNNVCISPGTVILALVILGVVLVISITATLWFALKRSEAKKFAHKTTSLAFSSPSGPAPYYRFNHW